MDWKRKLSSRKFWVCICSFVTAMLAAFRFDGAASQITAVIMAFGAVISYILAEGFVDATGVQDQTAESSGTDESKTA